MAKIIKDDCCERIIDARSYPLDPAKYPNILKWHPDANRILKDRIGYVDGHRPVYELRYVWETLFAPADLEKLEKSESALPGLI